ncbi:MAG: 4Fe-4S dicluster domain-containing protein [Syntrophaceae bacterium]|nr:4Fe-4S dicluster domain-containing protein [Syntrophaceae bacterium]
MIKLRKIVSGIIFIGFVLLFLGGEKLSVFLADLLPPFQLVPALIRSITQPAALFFAGLMFIILITLIFGRVYCSFLCPLGTLQDIVITLAHRTGRKPAYAFSRPQNTLRYIILALTVASLFTGILWLVNLLDPYSLVGRIFSYFFQPLLVYTYNLGIIILKPLNIFLYPKQTASIPMPDMVIAACFLLTILYLSVKHGRLYCNTLCPVGAFLGLLSHVSIFQLALRKESCSKCLRCESVCKAGCINPQAASIDMSRCIGCFNCLDACSTAAINYRPMWRRTRSSSWSPARRGFIFGSFAAAVALLSAFHRDIRNVAGIVLASSDPPVTPPGSQNVERFSKTCTACCLCVAACPTSVLTPSFLDYGPAGLLQPKMNYEKSYCDYECNVCGKVCPTGAISRIKLDDKKLTQIGEAKLLKDVCVVYVEHNNCGACGEVCPTHAIRFTDRENILYPEIDKQYCIGCGACQLACPTTPRSIVVHPHPVHKKAEKYITPKPAADSKKPPDKDFPF